jgi:hypothetical protein
MNWVRASIAEHALNFIALRYILSTLLVFVSPVGFASATVRAGSSTTLQAEGCQAFAPWLQVNQRLAHPEMLTTFDVQKLQRTSYKLKTELTLQIVHRFFSGQINMQQMARCIKGQPDFENFMSSLNGQIFDESITLLRQSRSPALNELMRLYEAKKQHGSILLFRMTGHTAVDVSPTGLKAGFHRGLKSIFMDIGLMTQNEWLFIFCHELIHALDHTLELATDQFNQPILVSKISRVARIYTINSLPDQKKIELDIWMNAGLNLGLLAEYRAWALCLKIYQEGLRTKLWQPIDWMEAMSREIQALAQNNSHQPGFSTSVSSQSTNFKLNKANLKAIFVYLDKRSADPYANAPDELAKKTEKDQSINGDGNSDASVSERILRNLLSQSMIRERLKAVRENLRKGPPPSLEEFSQFASR